MSFKNPRILFDAVYVNRSGGEVVLNVLIDGLRPHQESIHFLLDDRLIGKFVDLGLHHVTYLPATLIHRHRFYRANQHRYSRIFCFSGIPPMVRTNNECMTYLHNTLLIEHPGWGQLALKQLYMRLYQRNVNGWIVQTEFMRRLASRFFKLKPSDVAVLPFFKDPLPVPVRTIHSSYHFLYTSDGYPHKNHQRLFEAFERAWHECPDIVLHVTLSDSYCAPKHLVRKMHARGVPIIDHGFLTHEEIIRLYASMDCQVYPSLTESLGIGLIESAQAGLRVIASNRPYVFELIAPTDTFDPLDVMSITACLINMRSKPAKPASLRVRSHLSELVGRIVAEF